MLFRSTPPGPTAGDEPPDPPPPSDDAMQLMLALFFIAATGGDVRCTPKSLTPPPERAGQVRALWPLLLQCEHRLVIPTAGEAPQGVFARACVRTRSAGSQRKRTARCVAVRVQFVASSRSLSLSLRREGW